MFNMFRGSLKGPKEMLERSSASAGDNLYVYEVNYSVIRKRSVIERIPYPSMENLNPEPRD